MLQREGAQAEGLEERFEGGEGAHCIEYQELTRRKCECLFYVDILCCKWVTLILYVHHSWSTCILQKWDHYEGGGRTLCRWRRRLPAEIRPSALFIQMQLMHECCLFVLLSFCRFV